VLYSLMDERIIQALDLMRSIMREQIQTQAQITQIPSRDKE
jgi:hypothetical protein